jgi:hypothetical protein
VVPVFTGMKIDAVAPAIGMWLPSLTFSEKNARAHCVIVQSVPHPDKETSSTRASAAARRVVAKQPSAGLRIQRPGDGEKDARF